MSRKGCSLDNAACEGFFGRLKNEMFYNHNWNVVSISKFITILNDYMIWYNQKKIKVSLGNISPIEYRHSLRLIAYIINPRKCPYSQSERPIFYFLLSNFIIRLRLCKHTFPSSIHFQKLFLRYKSACFYSQCRFCRDTLP